MAERSQAKPVNVTCGKCNLLLSTHYCTCTGTNTPSYLCNDCILAHMNKFPNLQHSMIRVEMRVANLSAYQGRNDAFAEGRTELLRNLAKIDQCCADLASAVDHIITRLGQYRDNLVSQLQTWKETLSSEIYQCVYEVESTLTEEQVQLTGKYSEALRHFEAGNLVLFNYKVDTPAIEDCIQYLYSAEYPKPPRSLQTPQLALLTDDEVRLFNFQSLSWGAPVALATCIKCNEGSSYTVIEGNRLLCCGGETGTIGKAFSSAYLVEIRADQYPVTQLPYMNAARALPGVVHCEGATYVFGSSWRKCYAVPSITSQIVMPVLRAKCSHSHHKLGPLFPDT